MDYFISPIAASDTSETRITKHEFLILKQSRAQLAAAFSLEEVYEILLSNYRELELEALSGATTAMTSLPSKYEDHFELRSALNRRTLNLLSTARVYVDQFPQWLKQVGADAAPAKKKINEIYDTSAGYRFMEALRNHAQHVGRAIHGVKIEARWQSSGEQERLEFKVIPYATKTHLTQDKKFKKAVLNECPHLIPILPAARSYVGGISVVHKQVRLLVDPQASAARRAIESAINKHGVAASHRRAQLAAIAKEGNTIREEFPLLLEWDDVRSQLIARNRPLTNLERRSVSSLNPEAI